MQNRNHQKHLKCKCKKEDSFHLIDSQFLLKKGASLDFFLLKEAFKIMKFQDQIQA